MILDQIKARRAVFPAQYNDADISEEEIKILLEAANWAPTHRRTEPWRFKVFYSETSRRALSEFLGTTYTTTATKPSNVKLRKIREKPLQSSCVIAICFQRDSLESIPEWEEIAATAMAVQNMWLVAHDLGIGAYWSSPSLKDHLADHLPLNDGESCLGFFYLGKYEAELPLGTRKTEIAEKTRWL